MNLKDIEKYWTDESSDAFDTALVLFKKKKYTDSMFYLHLSVEKMLKGLFVNRMEKEAMWGHNLQAIASKIDSIKFSEETMILLGQITAFNVRARYDDYKKSFYMLCNKIFASDYINKTRELLSWLKSQLK